MNLNRKIDFSPPDMSFLEADEVAQALLSGWITTGKRTKLFERKISEYIGTEKTACLNSATAALELCLRILGIEPGDEVIVPAYTYTASAAVINHVGAKIVMIDIQPDTYELAYDQIESAITQRTKAIIPVDIGGRMCDYDKIYKAIENKRSVFVASNELQAIYNRVVVIADSAHGFGAKRKMSDNSWKKSGQCADFTAFSFHAVKNLTTGEGGAVTWRSTQGLDNEWLYNQFMLFSLHGQSKDAFNKNQLGAWEYDIVYTAYKCNMTDLTAAIGLKQLERYPDLIKRRREIITKYDEAFRKFKINSLIHYDDNHVSSGHLYMVSIPNISGKQRNEIITKMAQLNIACNVHYKPLPMMTAYKKIGFDIVNYPNSYNQYVNEITLPLHTLLTDQDVEYIINSFLDIVRQYI